MLQALTRQVSPTLANCELTFYDRQPIDVAKAIAQHRAYQECLRELGANIRTLPADPKFPDGVFVEDPAIVLDEIAVITRPGALSRRGETESIAEALRPFRELRWIQEPGTLEGGDVILIGKILFVGLSQRTNAGGISQLEEFVGAFGYRVVPVPVTGCLHLKSGACWAGGDTMLVNHDWVDTSVFHDFKMIAVPAEEPGASDVLPIGGKVLVPASFPRTCQVLRASGVDVLPVDVSELQKAEAGVTCMSLLFEG